MIHPMVMQRVDVDGGGALPPPASAPLTLGNQHANGQPGPDPYGFEAARRLGLDLIAAIDRVLVGNHQVGEIAAACLMSRGHLLIDDIPGVGKTLLAQVMAAAVGGTCHRIQGTPDLLPGDVTGSMVPDHDGLRLRFRPGPVFANIVVFDELNRTSPRTQSALLEAAEEATVSVDGVTHRLPDPFMLVATQNPIEILGTHRLGEGALDRFAAVVTPGRPAFADELEVLAGRRGRTLLADVRPVGSIDATAAARRAVEHVHVADPIAGYVVELLAATRSHPAVRLGASTRGGGGPDRPGAGDRRAARPQLRGARRRGGRRPTSPRAPGAGGGRIAGRRT